MYYASALEHKPHWILRTLAFYRKYIFFYLHPYGFRAYKCLHIDVITRLISERLQTEEIPASLDGDGHQAVTVWRLLCLCLIVEPRLLR